MKKENPFKKLQKIKITKKQQKQNTKETTEAHINKQRKNKKINTRRTPENK